MRIKNIFFDFDGVIAESVNVKTNAFYKIYGEFGKDIAGKVVEHHKNNGGMSRFEKFKLYHKEFLNISLNENEIQKLSKIFSKLVKKRTIAAPEVIGIRPFLEKHYSTMKFWVISATPTDEIREIVEMRKMEKFFIDCFGSPEKKDFWVGNIINDNRLEKDECVFIGDAIADYIAAIKNGIQFVLRETPEGKSLFKDINAPRFKVFSEFEKILKKLL